MNSAHLDIDDLAAAGLALHWVRPRSKAPVEDGWSRAPRYSAAELRRTHRDGYNVGVRLGEPSRTGAGYLHAVDLDIRDTARRDEALAALRAWLPHLERFPTVISGSSGESRHFYFVADRPFRSRKLAHSVEKVTGPDGREHWAWEVELFGTGKQVVLPPSVHPDTGRPYRWLQPFGVPEIDGLAPALPASEVEGWAPIVAAEDPGEPDEDAEFLAAVHGAPTDLSESAVQRTLDALPAPEWCEDRDGWLKVGAALHHQFEGGKRGYELWCAFSRRSAKFNERDQRRVWDSYRSRRRGITFRTLLAAAQAAGPEPGTSELDEVSETAGGLPRGPGGDIHWGKAFAKAQRGRLLCVRPGAYWRRWDGVRWASCQHAEELQAAKAFAADMLAKTAKGVAAGGGANLHKDALALFKSAHRLEAMLKMASVEPGIVTSAESFDRDPMLLGVANGVLDLKRRTLIPPEPGQMIHRASRVEFDPSATAPQWERFLERIQPNAAVRAFLQRAVGYSITASIDAEAFFFLHGQGANGKSVFANVLAALLGELAVTVGARLLIKSHNTAEADRLLVTLPGARVALANETAQGDLWDDQRVKALASREPITVRRLYQEAFEVWPTWKLWIRSNHLPGAHDASDGFWRRLIPIAFMVQIPEAERVGDLDRRIVETELSGVLNWALAGCAEWQRIGLAVPPEIERERKHYREETDLLGTWLGEYIEAAPNARLPIGAAFQSYQRFCRDQNVSAPSLPSFSRQMAGRGHKVAGSKKNGRQIPGLRLCERDPFDDADDIG